MTDPTPWFDPDNPDRVLPTVLHQALNGRLMVERRSPTLSALASGPRVITSVGPVDGSTGVPRRHTLDDLLQRMGAMRPVSPAPPAGRGRARYTAPIPPAPLPRISSIPPNAWASRHLRSYHSPTLYQLTHEYNPWLHRLASESFASLRARWTDLVDHVNLAGASDDAPDRRDVEPRQTRSNPDTTRAHGLRRPNALHAAEHGLHHLWCDTLAQALYQVPEAANPTPNQPVSWPPPASPTRTYYVWFDVRPALMLRQDLAHLGQLAHEVHHAWTASTGRPLDMGLRDRPMNPVARAWRPARRGPDMPLRCRPSAETRTTTPTPAPGHTGADGQPLPLHRSPVFHQLAANPDWANDVDGGLAIARDLLALGASPDGLQHMRHNAVHIAVERGNGALMRWLLDAGVPLNAATSQGWRALHLAVKSDRMDLAQELLARGSAHRLDGIGETFLEGAVVRRVVRLMTDRNHRLDPSQPVVMREAKPTALWTTPLHWAVLGDRINLLRWLMARGANPSVVDQDGNTVWDLVEGALPQKSPFAQPLRAAMNPPVSPVTPVVPAAFPPLTVRPGPPSTVITTTTVPSSPLVVALPAPRVIIFPVVRRRGLGPSVRYQTAEALRESFVLQEQAALRQAAHAEHRAGTTPKGNPRDQGLSEEPSCITTMGMGVNPGMTLDASAPVNRPARRRL